MHENCCLRSHRRLRELSFHARERSFYARELLVEVALMGTVCLYTICDIPYIIGAAPWQSEQSDNQIAM